MLVVNNFNNLTRWKVTNIVLSSSRSSKILATINEGYSVQASTRCGNLTAADVEVRSGAAELQSAGLRPDCSRVKQMLVKTVNCILL